jgi:dolichyl-phosphate beta-glucosyltransferase
MSTQKPEVSIVIPAYNEAHRIEHTIRRIFKELPNLSFEVIISEDGSTDNTVDIIKKLADEYEGKITVLRSKTRLGKGNGFLRGAFHSRGEYVILLDADFPTNTATVLNVTNYLRSGYDVVIGSRTHKLSILDPPAPPLREAIGKVFNAIVRLLFVVKIHDTQCGVKGFKKQVFSIIGPIMFTHMVFDVEVIVKAYACNLKVVEVPIYWSSKVGSKVRVLIDAMFMLNGLINIWLRLPSYKNRKKRASNMK